MLPQKHREASHTVHTCPNMTHFSIEKGGIGCKFRGCELDPLPQIIKEGEPFEVGECDCEMGRRKFIL